MLQKQNLYSDTYVGDMFNISVLRADKDSLKVFDGLSCKVIGFKKEIKPIMLHEINANTPIPGFYETLGNPVVRVETGHITEIPMLHLSPIGYRFTDNLLKNSLYLQARRKHKFISPLPSISFNIGDIVLVASHQEFLRDFLSEIIDIKIKSIGVYYIVSPSDNISEEIQEIRYDKIIDVIEHGELTELERLGKLHRCYESLSNRHLSRFKYSDDENTQLPEEN